MVVSGFAASLFACASAGDEPGGGPGVEGTPKTETASNGDVLEALRAMPEAEIVGATDDGVATEIRGDLAKVGDWQADDRASADALLRPALGTVLKPFRLGAEDVVLNKISADEAGNRHARYRQTRDGLDVIGGDLIVHVDVKGSIYSVNGTARGDLPNFTGKTQISEAAAAAKVAADARFLSMGLVGPGRQVYIILPDGAMTKAWELAFEGERGLDPQLDLVYVGADTGSIVAIHPKYHYAKNRAVYSANNGTSLPGTLRRSEGQAATTDIDVNAAYDNTGWTYDVYMNFFNRDSYNNAGAQLRSTVHYSTNYCNAFWNGSQMVYGDGSGSSCLPLARAIDVTAHELTHAVTENESGLVYSGESGGLSEAYSDIFGALAEAWLDGGRSGTTLAVSGDTWLVGEDILTPYLRKMDDPAADGVSKDYWYSGIGSVDVHYSSGPPNLAFYLLAAGGKHPRAGQTGRCPTTAPAVVGVGFDKAIRIFYKAQVDHLTSNASFASAKSATAAAAQALGYDAATVQSVNDAWGTVRVGACPGTTEPPPPTDGVLSSGVPVTGLADSVVGNMRFWKLDVPAGQSTVVFSLSGGSGDADMYVQFGSKPSTTVYQCRPYLNGNNETCTFTPPQAGTYWVGLRAYTAYSGASLTGTYSATPSGDPLLTNGVPVSNISGASASLKYWRINTPAGRTLTLRISGGTGDADMYTRFGARPTTSTYACRPYLNGNNETCTTASTSAGDYYVMLRGYTSYSGVTLIGSF